MHPRQIHPHHAPVALHRFTGDEYRIDIRGIHALHHRANGVVHGHDVELVGAKHNDVSVFAGGERAAFLIHAVVLGALDGGEFQDIARGEHLGHVLLVGANALENELAL